MLLRSHSLLLSVLFVLPLLLVSFVDGKLSSSRELLTDEPDKRVDSSDTDENHDAQLSRLQQNLAQLEMATDPPTINDELFTPAASLDVFKNVRITTHHTKKTCELSNIMVFHISSLTIHLISFLSLFPPSAHSLPPYNHPSILSTNQPTNHRCSPLLFVD